MAAPFFAFSFFPWERWAVCDCFAASEQIKLLRLALYLAVNAPPPSSISCSAAQSRVFHFLSFSCSIYGEREREKRALQQYEGGEKGQGNDTDTRVVVFCFFQIGKLRDEMRTSGKRKADEIYCKLFANRVHACA